MTNDNTLQKIFHEILIYKNQEDLEIFISYWYSPEIKENYHKII